MLRESIAICRQSKLYNDFTRDEKREVVMHVYHMMSEVMCSAVDVAINPGRLEPTCR